MRLSGRLSLLDYTYSLTLSNYKPFRKVEAKMPLLTQFPNNLACIENDVKADFEALSLDAYSSLKLQNSPQIEYFGKVPLNRQCAHSKPMEQFSKYMAFPANRKKFVTHSAGTNGAKFILNKEVRSLEIEIVFFY